MTFADNLKAIRKEQKLTQAELAIKAGISCSSIINYENGLRKNPPVSVMEKLANALGVSVMYLLGTYSVRTIDGTSYVDGEIVNQSQIPDAHKQLLDNSYLRLDESAQNNIVHVSNSLEKLNYEGQKEAVKRIEELTEIPRYQKRKD